MDRFTRYGIGYSWEVTNDIQIFINPDVEDSIVFGFVFKTVFFQTETEKKRSELDF